MTDTVFIGMETSGELRRRFQNLGFFTVSADILPAEDGALYDEGELGGHLQMDVFEALEYLWIRCLWPTVGVFHPTCTNLTNSAAWAFGDGPYHQKVKPGTLVGQARRDAREKALNDVRRIMALPIKRKVIENPVGAISTAIRKPSQIIQPYQFGDDASKATCLWYVGKGGEPLPEMRLYIDPDLYIPPTLRPNSTYRWANQTDTGQNRLSPGEQRWKDRSRTYPGIADAMAQHWHHFVDMD